MNKVEESSGADSPEQSGIVSVNSRSRPKEGNIVGKVIFVVAAVSVFGAMGLMFYNKMNAASATQIEAPKTAEDEAPNNVNEPANIQAGRDFERDPLKPGAAVEPQGTVALPKQDQMIFTRRCAEGDEGAPLTAPDGREARDSKGKPIMVCADGRILVPAVQPIDGETAKVKPIEMQQSAGGSADSGQQTATQSGEVKRSRFAGAALLKTEDMPMSSIGQSESNSRRDQATNNLNAVTTMTEKLLAANSGNRGGSAPPFGALSMGNNGNGGGASPSQTEPIGSLLSSSATGKARATMLGNRSLMVAKGRSIDCGLSVRVINEVSGMTSCVVTRDVYSDDGRVVLVERGSEATGEYTAQMAQGQRRLFIIWNRIKTPKGVVINIDSPTTDSLGTSGIDGYVDNRWLDRLGAAFLLSIIQDAIAYKTATDAANGSAAAAAMENTSNTGNTMVEKILESTINIKPTIYKNQGDRIAISVARDLDFGDVYELDTQ
jgi:type IV secretion system protein VirB10